MSFDHSFCFPYPTAERYSVDQNGKVWDSKRNRLVSQNTQGGLVRIVHNDGTVKALKAGRMTAECFCDHPEGADCVDHIDRDPSNNHFLNLRWVTYSENNANRKLLANSSTGVKHVHYTKKRDSYQVTIRKDGELHYFGTFHNFDEACKVAKENGEFVHGMFNVI